MAKKGQRILVRLMNKKSGTFYVSEKNRINKTDKIKIKKFDKKTGKHEEFEEVKIK